ANIWFSHPRNYGPGSNTCPIFSNHHGLIRKYGLNMCRRHFFISCLSSFTSLFVVETRRLLSGEGSDVLSLPFLPPPLLNCHRSLPLMNAPKQRAQLLETATPCHEYKKRSDPQKLFLHAH
ncbi:hypothetical protein PMAYCL1PPCAC_09064, partial [Pristionchus mayeri]